MESTGFLDALNSAPVPGIKIKKKKPGPNNAKAVSPTSNKVQFTLHTHSSFMKGKLSLPVGVGDDQQCSVYPSKPKPRIGIFPI